MSKNKAEASALEFMRKFGATLVGDDLALVKMVDEMRNGIAFINQDNRRCTNIDFRVNLDNEFRGKSVTVGQICSYSFYPVLRELVVPPGATTKEGEYTTEEGAETLTSYEF